MKRKTKLFGCGIIVLWMILPILSVFAASMIANAAECQLDEGGVHPCVVFGKDVGESLYSMFVMGWFTFLTVPSGLAALAVLLVVVIVDAVRKRASQGAPER